jgi:hypothetical protein
MVSPIASRTLFSSDANSEQIELASLASTSDHEEASESTSNRDRHNSSRSSLASQDFYMEERHSLPMVPLSTTVDGMTGDAPPKTVSFRNGLGLVIGLQIGSGIFSYATIRLQS